MNFEHKKGDTFNAVSFQIKKNTIPVDLTDYVIEMQLKKEACGEPFLSFTSVGSDGITINDAINGGFRINEQIIDIDAFNYLYDIQFTDDNGVIKTYITGTFKIIKDITR